MDVAKQGDPRGQDAVACFYFGEHGVHPGTPPKDMKEAMKWFRMAADQGEADAQDHVGGFYLSGIGMPKNLVEAARWERRAADQGFTDAQFGHAIIYYDGKGVPQDYVQSYMWVTLAIENAKVRHDNGLGTLAQMNTWQKEIAKRMTKEQVAEAQRLASNWKPHVSRATCIVHPEMCPK
jgi:hypothetical protein